MSLVSLFDLPGETVDPCGVAWGRGSLAEANDLLRREHYLGPLTSGGAALVFVGRRDGEVVVCQIWRRPTSRTLPNDGTWLELSRWCLTPAAGPNAGSRCHSAVVPILRDMGARTIVSYSDPSQGHTGALYRACNWLWAPTWIRLRPPPTGNHHWTPGAGQAAKDRWVFHVTKADPARSVLPTDDLAAVRYWMRNGTEVERRWAAGSPYIPTLMHSLDCDMDEDCWCAPERAA
jgi:hypothetical protein